MPADFSDVQNLPSDSRFLDVLHERVVVADGAMGTMLQDAGERGEDAVRHFVLHGDRLILTAKTHEMGEDHERKVVWQRVASPQP